ncbi:acid-sensing ion channel 1C-like [Lytechinus pictus]|uniref:acid-sensing ion channel 1C-like n=1 Tax=Lytechinus pictus TaxID=7653 RepID=UPI0030B9F0CD
MDDLETVNTYRGSARRITVKSAQEADELPHKTAVTTVSGTVRDGAVTTSFDYPKYRDRVSWIAVVFKSVPDSVGLAGLKYAFNAGEVRWRRFLWTLLVLSGFGVCLYQVVDRSMHFASHPKSVDVSINQVSSIEFPSVAICSYNRYRASAVNGTEYGRFLTDTFVNPTTMNVSQYYDTLSSGSFNDLLFNTSHILEQSILEVFWNRFPVYPTTKYFSLKMTDWGPCFIFNDADNGLEGLQLEASGRATAGLLISVNIHQDEYFYDPWSYMAAGLHVAVYPRGTQPFMEDIGFSVAPGTSTLVGLDLEENVYLPPVYGECENKTLNHFDYYGGLECKIECVGSFLASRCGCKVLHFPGDVPDCSPWQFFTCINPVLGDFVNNVSCNCTPPCSTRNYVTTLSQAAYPANFFSEPLASLYNETAEYFRQNICRLTFYFREMNVVKRVQQKDYTFFSLLCDIGGSLGLWLGGSILTFFEILDLFGHSTYIYTRRTP